MSMAKARLATLAIQQALLDLDVYDVKASIGSIVVQDQPSARQVGGDAPTKIEAAILHIKLDEVSPEVKIFIDAELDIRGVGSAWVGVFQKKASDDDIEALAARIKAAIPAAIMQVSMIQRMKKLSRR